MYTRCWRNTKEYYRFLSRSFWREPQFSTMQIHKSFLKITWLIRARVSAMQEVFLILTGKRLVFVVDLLRAGRLVSQTSSPCSLAGRTDVRKGGHVAKPLARARGCLPAFLTRMCHLFFLLCFSISAAQRLHRTYLKTSAGRFWISFRRKEDRVFPLLPLPASLKQGFKALGEKSSSYRKLFCFLMKWTLIFL